MRRYRVAISETDCYETFVEAESVEEAREKVSEALYEHGTSDYKYVFGDVEITDVWEEDE